MDGKHLFEVIRRIHRELSAREREYERKNIAHRLREDWGYAFYTGKFVAYLFLLRQDGYPLKTGDKAFAARIRKYR